MCMNLLKKIATARLPCTEGDSAVIDRLRVLEAAGHIKVLIQPVHADFDHCLRQPPAIVLEITPCGRSALSTKAAEEQAPLPAMPRPARISLSKAAGMVLDLAHLVAWFSSGTRHDQGLPRLAAHITGDPSCLNASSLPPTVPRSRRKP